MSIKHFNSMISRLATGRAWRGKIIRAILEVIAEQIQGITDELIIISRIDFILFGEEIDLSTLLNDDLYTLGSDFASLGDQIESAGRLVIWEFILDLLPIGSIEERTNAIIQAIINAGSISLIALQNTLQDNGYNVYVHPNSSGIAGSLVTYSTTTTYGGSIGDPGAPVRYVPGLQAVDPSTIPHSLCVNYIDESEDDSFYSSGYTSDRRRWEYGFFIGGATFLGRADVDFDKKAAFRELILRAKPGSMWAFLLIDYV